MLLNDDRFEHQRQRWLRGAWLLCTLCIALVATLWSAPPRLAVGNHVIYLNNDVLWTADSQGNNREQVTESGSENRVSAIDLSPDGTTAVARGFFHGTEGLSLVNLATHARTQIYTASAVARPRFSPDGKKIIFDTAGGEPDIYEINTNGTGLTPIITWKGWQSDPDFSPDGTKIVFDSATNSKGKSLGENDQLFVANANGSNPVQVTKKSTAMAQAENGTFSPSGGVLAFRGENKEGHFIFTISTSGTGQAQITTGGNGGVPSWSPDGSKILFQTSRIKGANGEDLYTVESKGGNEQPFITAPVGETIQDGRYPKTALAYRFMPILDFSSQEKWRPLNVEAFLSEVEPATGQAWDQICNETCTPLLGEASLKTAPYPYDYIKQHNSGGEPNSYRSPYSGCIHTVEGTEVLDCDSGPESSIYYHVVGPSPAGYQYIDYWIFYRYNQGFLDIGNHAGDWEGITVAPSADYSTFHFAEFSEHGKWKSFLRENLECDNAGEHSCGTEPAEHYKGLHVMSFPASGSHANYTRPNSGPSEDGNTDGKAPWGNNLNPEALLLMPATATQGSAWTTGPENWTDWPGRWGETQPGELELPGESQSPCSPAAPCSKDHASHFFAPWTGAECETGAACPAKASQPQPVNCSDWFGYSVTALACEPRAMQHALGSRRLGLHGKFRLRLVNQRRNAATAPGLAQAVGHPLHVGEQVQLTDAMPAGTTLLVHLQAAHGLLSAVFRGIGGFHGRSVIAVRRRGKLPVAYLIQGPHQRAANVVLRETVAGSR
jgi:hypothetical protein